MRDWRSMVGSLIEISGLETNLLPASIYWYVREQQRGTVSFHYIVYMLYSVFHYSIITYVILYYCVLFYSILFYYIILYYIVRNRASKQSYFNSIPPASRRMHARRHSHTYTHIRPILLLTLWNSEGLT